MYFPFLNFPELGKKSEKEKSPLIKKRLAFTQLTQQIIGIQEQRVYAKQMKVLEKLPNSRHKINLKCE